MTLISFLLLTPVQAEIHALRGGVLSHSTGPVSNGQEHGVDVHIEAAFNDIFLNGYYALGMDLSTQGETSFVYTGLSWEGRFFRRVHLGGFLGLGLHDGELDGNRDDRRLLGTRVLFRTAVEVGWYVDDVWCLSFMYDHYSNLGIGDVRNQGNDNMGLRLSYDF